MKTTVEIEDDSWLAHPMTWKNPRGSGIVKNKNRERFIEFGIPTPKRKNDNLKGGDRIGWEEITITPEMVGKKVAVFTSIEIKGPGDTIKDGQKDWHNLVLESGGISEIWFEDKIIKEKIE